MTGVRGNKNGANSRGQPARILGYTIAFRNSRHGASWVENLAHQKVWAGRCRFTVVCASKGELRFSHLFFGLANKQTYLDASLHFFVAGKLEPGGCIGADLLH